MINEKLKTIRTKNNLTQKEVANYLNISRSTYNNYEQNVAEPSIDSLKKLSQLYRKTVDELIGIESEIINLKILEPEISTLIKKIIKMNETQKAQTINFVTALTMFDD